MSNIIIVLHFDDVFGSFDVQYKPIYDKIQGEFKNFSNVKTFYKQILKKCTRPNLINLFNFLKSQTRTQNIYKIIIISRHDEKYVENTMNMLYEMYDATEMMLSTDILCKRQIDSLEHAKRNNYLIFVNSTFFIKIPSHAVINVAHYGVHLSIDYISKLLESHENRDELIKFVTPIKTQLLSIAKKIDSDGCEIMPIDENESNIMVSKIAEHIACVQKIESILKKSSIISIEDYRTMASNKLSHSMLKTLFEFHIESIQTKDDDVLYKIFLNHICKYWEFMRHMTKLSLDLLLMYDNNSHVVNVGESLHKMHFLQESLHNIYPDQVKQFFISQKQINEQDYIRPEFNIFPISKLQEITKLLGIIMVPKINMNTLKTEIRTSTFNIKKYYENIETINNEKSQQLIKDLIIKYKLLEYFKHHHVDVNTIIKRFQDFNKRTIFIDRSESGKSIVGFFLIYNGFFNIDTSLDKNIFKEAIKFVGFADNYGDSHDILRAKLIEYTIEKLFGTKKLYLEKGVFMDIQLCKQQNFNCLSKSVFDFCSMPESNSGDTRCIINAPITNSTDILELNNILMKSPNSQNCNLTLLIIIDYIYDNIDHIQYIIDNYDEFNQRNDYLIHNDIKINGDKPTLDFNNYPLIVTQKKAIQKMPYKIVYDSYI